MSGFAAVTSVQPPDAKSASAPAAAGAGVGAVAAAAAAAATPAAQIAAAPATAAANRKDNGTEKGVGAVGGGGGGGQEIISLHIGNAGVNVGHELWQLYALEMLQCKQPPAPGVMRPKDAVDDNATTTWFTSRWYHTSGDAKLNGDAAFAGPGGVTARAVFVDLQTQATDEVRVGPLRAQFPAHAFVTRSHGTSDGCGLYPRGYRLATHANGKDEALGARTLEATRKQLETCDAAQGFVLHHALGGATGSGVASAVAQLLADTFSQHLRITCSVMPFYPLSLVWPERYNTLLALHALCDSTHAQVVVDSSVVHQLLYRAYHRDDGTDYGGHAFGNEEIAQVLANAVTRPWRVAPTSHAASSITAPPLPAAVGTRMRDTVDACVPYDRLALLTPCYTRFQSAEETVYAAPSATELFDDLLKSQCSFVDGVSPRRGRVMGAAMYFMGDITALTAQQAWRNVQHISRRGMTVCDWLPDPFRVSVWSDAPCVKPGGNWAMQSRVVSALVNHTDVGEAVFDRTLHTSDLMFRKRAFLHHYLEAGMHMDEFRDARENMVARSYDYAEVAREHADDGADSAVADNANGADVAPGAAGAPAAAGPSHTPVRTGSDAAL